MAWICLMAAYIGVQAMAPRLNNGPIKYTTSTFPFSVVNKPNFSKVRILNIKPVYQQGMHLGEDNYHIEVSASGYTTQRLWVKHSRGSRPVLIALSKKGVANVH